MLWLGGGGILVAGSIVMKLGGVVKYQCGGEEEGIEVDVFRDKLVLRSASSSLGKNKGLLVAALSAKPIPFIDQDEKATMMHSVIYVRIIRCLSI